MAKVGDRFVARWTPRGAGLLSVEQGDGGYLGVDYADGVDTRWEDITCFPGNTLVDLDGPALRAVMRRWWAGSLVELTDADGNILAGTPNHPVLTKRGWLPLNLIEKGDHVIGGSFRQGELGSDPNVKRRQSTLAEVFNAATVGSSHRRLAGLPVDFHGDGTDSDIDVVLVDSELRKRIQSTLAQPSQHLSFPLADYFDLPGCATGKYVGTQGLSFASSGPITSHHGSRFRSHVGMAESDGFRLRAARNVQAFQLAEDRVFRYANSASNLRGTVALSVEAGDGIGTNGHAPVATYGIPTGLDDAIDRAKRDPQGTGYRVNGFPVQIAEHKVVGIRQIEFSGHVFNLSTESEWYVANGIIAHNCLGPLLNTLSLAAAGGTVANVNGMAIAPIAMQAAGPFLYVIRGTKWAKVALTGGAAALTLSSNDTETALGEAATGILPVTNAAGTTEILICMDNTIARCITAVGAGATDTHSAQTGNYKWTVAGFGDSDAAVQVVLLAGRGTGTTQNLIQQVALSGSTVLSTATPTTRATVAGPPLVYKSIAMDGDKILIGTDRGPLYLNNQSQAFRPLIGWLAPDAGNCTPMALWATGLGTSVIIALKRALRWSKNVINGGSFGPETYPENTSPVSGTNTAFAQSDRWGYFAFYNTKDDITYLCAARDREGQDWHRHSVSYFPLMTLGAGIECHSMLYTGTEGNTDRTLGMVVLGRDSNLGYFDEGRADRFYEDTAYPYAASGTLYLTEMRRQADFYKDIDFFVVETENCTADETITLSVTCTDRYGNSSTTQIGGAISGNGLHFLQVKGVTELTQARFVKPQIAFARGSTATNSPRVKGDILMDYTLAAIPHG